VALSTRPRIFPEALLLILIWVGIWPQWGEEALTPAAPLVELPIPAARLLAGLSPLSPGQWVTLKAFSPDDEDFVPQCYVGVEIREFELQGTGTILAAIPAKEVASLEAALADEKVRLTYHLVEQQPDGSLSPSASTCLPAAPAAAPPTPAQVTLELPSTDLQPRADSLKKDSRLRLVVAMTRPAEVQPPAKPDPDASAATACVTVTGFVDAQGAVQSNYDAKLTKNVQLQLPSKEISRIAATLAVPSRIWMLPDEACAKYSPTSAP
jgi:hypothetical protein